MSSATVRAYWFGASATLPAGSSAEGGCTFSLDDALAGSTPVVIPNSTGTVYSWFKNLGLDVTSTGTTNMSNRNIDTLASLTTGLFLYYQAVASASYSQPSGSNLPTASGSNGHTPSGYTLLSTSESQYDNSSVATSSTGLNGKLCQCVFGVDNTYVSGAGSSVSCSSIQMLYDEQ